METQYQQVVSHLIKHTYIDARIARDEYGVANLSSIIARMRKLVAVRTELQPWVSKHTGKWTSFARYHI